MLFRFRAAPLATALAAVSFSLGSQALAQSPVNSALSTQTAPPAAKAGQSVPGQPQAQAAITQPAVDDAPTLPGQPGPAPVAPSAAALAPAGDAAWLMERRHLEREAERASLIARAEKEKAAARGGDTPFDGKFNLPPLPVAAAAAPVPTTPPPPPKTSSLRVVGISLPEGGQAVVTLLVGENEQRKFQAGDLLPDGSTLVGADLDHLVIRRKGAKKVTSIRAE